MLLKGFIEQQVKGIRAFLDDPERNLLFYRVEPDLELHAAKLLAAWGDRETNAEISLALTGTFATREGFYREAEQVLMEVVNQVVEAFEEDGLPLPVPAGAPWDRTRPSGAPEENFAELLEGVARGLSLYFPKSIFVLRFDAVHDAGAAAASLLRLSAAIASPAVKVVVMDERRQPLFPTLTARHQRYQSTAIRSDDDDAGAALGALLQSGPLRTLGVSLGSAQLGRLDAHLTEGPLLPAWVRVFRVGAECSSRAQFGNDLYLQLRKMVPGGEQDDALPKDLYDLRSLDMPEAAFTEAVERLLEGALNPGEVALVAVRVESVQEERVWLLFLSYLAAQAVSGRVKYLLIDVDGAALIPVLEETDVQSATLEFDLKADTIEADAKAAMSDPKTPLAEQVQYKMMVGNFACSRGEYETGLPLLAEAAVTSEDNGLANEQTMSWWSIGQGLQLQGSYADARNAYVEALNLAMEQDNDPNVASALMKVGHTFFLQEAYDDAIKSYDAAHKTWLSMGHELGQCDALVWTGEAHAAAGRLPEGEKNLQEAHDIYGAMKAPFEDWSRRGRAEVLERLARVKRKAGQGDEASRCQQEARDLGSQGIAAEKPT